MSVSGTSAGVGQELTTISETRFRILAGLLLLFLSLFQNSPILRGQVPLPVNLILRYPLWNSTRPGVLADQRLDVFGDQMYQFYPWFEFLARSARQGVLPLWNPHSLLGTPFQASTQTRVFYPLTISYLLFDPVVAWTLNYVLAPVLAGFFTLLFARSIGLSRSGSLVAAITFAFSGFLFTWSGWPHADTALWLPLVLYAVQRLHIRVSLANISLLAVAFAVSFFGGSPGVAASIALAVSLFAGFRLLVPTAGSGRATRRNFVRGFLIAGILACGLSAIQLLPMLEWVGQTARSPVLSDYGKWHVQSSQFVAFFSRDAQVTPNNAGLVFPEEAMYCGILALILAAHSFLSPRREALFFALLAVIGIEVVFGWGLPFWLTSHAPGFAAFNNRRFILLVSFSVAILAGLGLSRLQERWKSGLADDAWWASWLIGCAAVLLGTLHLWERFLGTSQGDRRWLYSPFSTALLLIVAAVLCGPFLRKVKYLHLAVVAVVVLDLLSYARRHASFSPARDFLPEPEAFSMLRKSDDSTYRILGIEASIPFNYEVIAGFFSPAGYDYPLRRTARLLDFVSAGEQWSDFTLSTIQRDPNRLLDLMNVKYLVANKQRQLARRLGGNEDRFRLFWADDNVEIIENRSSLPRAFPIPASRAVVIGDDEQALSRVTHSSFDPGRDVVLNAAPVFAKARAGGGSDGESIQPGIDMIDLSTTVDEPSIVVISDIWYPGWRVRVNGREHQLLRTDYAFKGVALAPGSHHIRFYFRPMSFIAGAAISAVTLIGIIAAQFGGKRRRGEENA